MILQLAVVMLALMSSLAMAKEHKVCPHLVIDADIMFTFSQTETRLLCGDSGNAPWAEPPEAQIRAFLISFLQSRGYFVPTFQRRDDGLLVKAGERTKIKKVKATGMPPETTIEPYWVPPLKPLTPDLLNEYQGMVEMDVKSVGYPCPELTAEANVPDKTMTINVTSGPRQTIESIKNELDSHLQPEMFRRYYPFKEGDIFNGNLVVLAGNRIKSEDILSSVYMVSRCGDKGATITQKGVLGAPRRMSVGFGVNTETFVLLKASYRNARVDDQASRYDAIVKADYRTQRVESSFTWYVGPPTSSLHLKPLVSYQRLNERSYETITTTASFWAGMYGDLWGERWQVYMGPNLNLIQTKRGEAPSFTRLVELEANTQWQSHDYELNQLNPISGHRVDLRVTSASQRLNSTVTANQFEIQAKKLWSAINLIPPLIIVGVRGGLSSTQAEKDVLLPISYQHFLGGSADLRGFPRKSIPSTQVGARTAAYSSLEVRLVTIVPYSLQPIVFVDYGVTGKDYMQLDRPQYYSPGMGLIWQSPIGALRANVAKGFILNEPKELDHPVPAGWVALFSFGEDF